MQVGVTPFAGVWIEMLMENIILHVIDVTPFAGVWIEIFDSSEFVGDKFASLPSRECGLKFRLKNQHS